MSSLLTSQLLGLTLDRKEERMEEDIEQQAPQQGNGRRRFRKRKSRKQQSEKKHVMASVCLHATCIDPECGVCESGYLDMIRCLRRFCLENGIEVSVNPLCVCAAYQRRTLTCLRKPRLGTLNAAHFSQDNVELVE